MKISKDAMAVVLAGLVFVVPACTDHSRDETKQATDRALEATRSGADKALEATKDAANKTIDVAGTAGQDVADATKEAAQKTAEETKEIAAEAAQKGSDGWITTKVKAKFSDETSLRGSDINVDTRDHVVTLRGTVTTADGRARAATIARGTEGVTKVVNQLVVK